MGRCCSKESKVTESASDDEKEDTKESVENKEKEDTKEDTKEDKKEDRKEDRKEKEYNDEENENEYEEIINRPYVFEDIIDTKHIKYMDSFEEEKEKTKTLFWGIGIENESYLQWSVRQDHASFCKLKPKRERYSVNYYKNFLEKPLENVMNELKSLKHMSYPIFINSHTFQKTDPTFCHQTYYDVNSTPNPSFTESIHSILLRECEFYKEVYDKSVVFDGDTIEFITQNYYKTTVQDSINELVELKEKWLKEVAPYLERYAKEQSLESLGSVMYPTCNEGIVSFMTTGRQNMGICNTQTIHINITLPTWLENGSIVDKSEFAKQHLAFISMLQVVEPLISAVYGTPDLFSVIDPSYSIGSQRGTRSRYISLQTFDVHRPINGKLLLMKRPEDPEHWYNRLVDSPYELHTEIGYDVNFNKFKNHGVEIRFLDWIPEIYLKDLIDFFLLLAQHALTVGFSSMKVSNYHDIVLCCLRKGCMGVLKQSWIETILHDLCLTMNNYTSMTNPFSLLSAISHDLYCRYSQSEMIQLLSPNMKEPKLFNYNEMVFKQFYKQIYGKRQLIIRSELSLFEQRTPIVPSDLIVLLPEFDILVESSQTRCFSDNDYKDAGAQIIPSGSWTNYPNAIIVGLKGLRKGEVPHKNQIIFHFAHCYKKQEGYREILRPLVGSKMIDYEFMLDDRGKRTLSFCSQAGYVGAYLTLMSYYASTIIETETSFHSFQFHPPTMDKFLKGFIPYQPKPRILLIGCGTVGKACKDVIESFGLSCHVKTSKDQILSKEILNYDILIHAIRLIPDELIQPFLTEDDIDSRDRKLRLITDLSCDLGHPMNPLPIYSQYGTKEKPIQRLRNSSWYVPPLDLISVPYLPSFDPIRSSTEFSSELIWYLSECKWLPYTQTKNEMIRAMNRSYDTFLRVCEEERWDN
jgi:alanine dehydrogenase